jgi:RNA polymerase sigma-70 factor (ECF subfamily)
MTGPPAPPAIDTATLASVARIARARWPGLGLTDADFARHLAGLGVGADVLRARGEDLFLAAACASGEPAALEALEKEHLVGLGSYVGGRLDVGDAFVDELRQAVRLRLLFDRPPRITGYSGIGTLRSFVRVVAVRLGFDLLEADRRQPLPADPEVLARHLASSPAVESRLTLAEHGPRFQAAIEEAVRGLTAREKAVLRFHFVESLNIEAIGKIYRVHRATVARWLVDIRRQLWVTVEKRMRFELRMTPSEFRSLLGLVRDELRISFSRVLGP